jgi:hypothetical protein
MQLRTQRKPYMVRSRLLHPLTGRTRSAQVPIWELYIGSIEGMECRVSKEYAQATQGEEEKPTVNLEPVVRELRYTGVLRQMRYRDLLQYNQAYYTLLVIPATSIFDCFPATYWAR